MSQPRPHVLIIVQNLPLPLDRRVWMECQELRDAGYEVSAITPKGPGDPSLAVVDDVHLYKYRMPLQAQGFVGYVAEFLWALLRVAMLSVKVWRRSRFDVIQACNPPDTYWSLARLWRVRGVRFVFDQHDLNPEVFRSRFGEPTSVTARAQYRTLLWLERRTYRAADRVISTNESYRRIALERGGKRPQDVTVVRSGPDTTQLRPGEADPALRKGRRYLGVYIGIMGPQDGVDGLLDALAYYVHELGRTDLHVALLGFGDCLEDLKKQAVDLELTEYVTFTGRVGVPEIVRYLSSAHVGLAPDQPSPLNDVSTMNKVMEYMALGLPVVTFDLPESRVSAGEAAVYVPGSDVTAFAQAVADLLDDPARREQMGALARRRAEELLDWAPQGRAYVSVFDAVTGATRGATRSVTREAPRAAEPARSLPMTTPKD